MWLDLGKPSIQDKHTINAMHVFSTRSRKLTRMLYSCWRTLLPAVMEVKLSYWGTISLFSQACWPPRQGSCSLMEPICYLEFQPAGYQRWIPWLTKWRLTFIEHTGLCINGNSNDLGLLCRNWNYIFIIVYACMHSARKLCGNAFRP